MKKLLIMAILAGFTYFGSNAQTTRGNSAFGHSHKKIKKYRKQHHLAPVVAQRRAINETHQTSIRTVKQNDALNNSQQRDLVKQANGLHKQEMRTVRMNRNAGKH